MWMTHLAMAIVQGFWLHSYSLLWIFFMTIPSSVLPEMVYRVDPLALLSGTLRTYQKAGCDTEQVSLSCPRGTSISIEVAQYGNSVGGDGNAAVSICPPSSEETILEAMHAGAEIEVKPTENCLPHALQYSLLQHVVESCQKKSHCKFHVTPLNGDDPCPTRRKFVEVAYKCRPYEFRSKVACENDVIQLVCNPYSRIAIYSASFGRTEYESIQCSQPQGVMEESCLVSYATETVMEVCHGRRRCTVTADSATFGNPCRPDSRVYLKIVYTCIPRKVLKTQFDLSTEPDEPQQLDMDQNQDDLYDEDQFYRESEAIPPEPKLHRELSKSSVISDIPLDFEPTSSVNPPLRSREGNQLEVFYPKTPIQKKISTKSSVERDIVLIPATTFKYPLNKTFSSKRSDCDDKPIGFIAEWINAYIYLAQNQEKFYLYLIISVTAGVLLCLILVIGRLLIQKRRLKKEPNSQPQTPGETTIPNGFSDDISEIDADIDLTTPLPLPSVSRSDQNYGVYAPSPSPYGNLGPSNLSHTSTTMLVPSNSIVGAQSPAIIGASNTLMYPTVNTPTGTMMNAHYPPVYLSGSIMGHGTLRRPREFEHTPPRIMSKIDADQQYYYG